MSYRWTLRSPDESVTCEMAWSNLRRNRVTAEMLEPVLAFLQDIEYTPDEATLLRAVRAAGIRASGAVGWSLASLLKREKTP